MTFECEVAGSFRRHHNSTAFLSHLSSVFRVTPHHHPITSNRPNSLECSARQSVN